MSVAPTPKPAKALKKSSSKANAVASSSSSPKKQAANGSTTRSSASKQPDFSYRQTRMRLSVPPRFTGDLHSGAEEMLDSMVMRHIPKLQGVLLSYSKLEFLGDAGNILYDCPFAVVDVEFEAVIWAPKVGQVLVGTHSLSSPSHLSLLVHQTFNVSIPLNHIPQSEYTFDRSMSSKEEEEEEVEAAMLGSDAEGEREGDDEHEDASEKKEKKIASEGRWKSTVTGRAIGAEGSPVEFTVVGLTITSQILSLTGSLLSDPFNPPALGPSLSSNYPETNPVDLDLDLDDDDEEFPLSTSTKSQPPPKLQAPAKSARKRAVSVDYSSSSSDESDDEPAPPKKKAAVDHLDTEFPLLNKDGEPAKKKARKEKASGEVDMSLHRAERKQAKKDGKKEKKSKK